MRDVLFAMFGFVIGFGAAILIGAIHRMRKRAFGAMGADIGSFRRRMGPR